MITMADIARKAGVSRSTASFVLNNRQAELRISDVTRGRVLDAARQLGYQRNDLARAVGSGKNYVLGFLKMSPGEQETHLLEGMLKAAAEADYLLKVLPGGDEPYEEVARRCVEHVWPGWLPVASCTRRPRPPFARSWAPTASRSSLSTITWTTEPCRRRVV